MSCLNCSIKDLRFEVNVNSIELEKTIISYLSKHHPITKRDNTIIVNEPALRDLYDFSTDHLSDDMISYRIIGEQWQSIYTADEVFSADWIDTVIQNKQIISHYQPIITADKQIYAYELLARFMDEEGKVIYPNEIFSAARIRGRLYALDRLCRLTAVKYAKKITNAKAFINFIPTSIYSPEHCLKSTTMLADQLGIKTNTLVFEVVETDKVEDVNHLKRILTYYKERGFSYALDDVGEGYSTIDLLEELIPAYMKLDMKYVQGVASDGEKQKKALQLLSKAKEIGSIPLAEGVETETDFNWLKTQGFELFQGYLFGKPAKEPVMSISK
jgi:EAL domain-containing protein (putative c-di-GMP-specific phosphodiesterase class I)